MKSFLYGKKRFVAAGIVAASLAGGAYAFANSLSVTSDTLAAGSSTVLSCQATAVNASYTTAYDSTASTSGYKVTSVNLSGVAAGCNGKSATLELTGSGGSALASSGPVTLATGNTNTFNISGVIDANGVTGISVVVTG